MSIASEYADRVRAAKVEPEEFRVDLGLSGTFRACVSREGQLHCCGAALPEAKALELAAWILRTFGEPEVRGRDIRPTHLEPW